MNPEKGKSVFHFILAKLVRVNKYLLNHQIQGILVYDGRFKQMNMSPYKLSKS